jgi:RimJ/RimL family protein N-acetyltransferase
MTNISLRPIDLAEKAELGVMTNISLRPIDLAEKAELAALQSEVFDDYEHSELLAEVLDAEALVRPKAEPPVLPAAFGVAAFRGNTLVGWSQGFRQGTSEFYMLNSGVASAQRRNGIYTVMVKAVLAHAKEQGYQRVTSRHSAGNTPVLIAKLRLGFRVSGFEYSEVYGPLVQLTFLVNEARDKLYRVRAASIRTPPR